MAVSGALIVEGGVQVTAPGCVARTGYREQIRRIAPPHLRERTEELAALAAFCTEPNEGPYLWLRGPAWAGKSALLSWFALHPPEGVHLVPFFITGRFAGQNDRIGFCDVVMEQLAAFLGQPMPAQVTDATREGHLLSLIDEAARVCRENAERLVLVVDGLDEDQGVTARPESYSIAALLPSRPQAGLRVIVASRPHPPIPADVPDGHALRDPRVVDLSVSPHAEAVRADAERELQRLADASGLEREILGLITAADGGLSEQDLAELTGASTYTVGRHTRTVSGRTFASLLSPWTKEEVYVLGHDELRSTALQMLGSKGVAGHRERLHQWAESYRNEGWPARTPEYLLHGYFRSLTVSGDLRRVIANATDATRHNRMLHMTGGDAAAFIEVRTAQELILAQQDPDLLAMARLAVHHDELKARNDSVPVGLPALWAALGAPERAEAVLNGIVVPDRYNRALLALLETFLTAGDLDRARALAETAGQVGVRARALADVAKAMCAAGDLAGAEEVALLVEDPRQQTSALSDLTRAAVAAGELARARRLVERAAQGAVKVTKPMHRAAAIGSVAGCLTCLGDRDRALSLVRTIPGPFHRARALGNLALAATVAGERAQWEALSAEAEAIAYDLPQPAARAKLLATLARTAVRAGQQERAKDLAQEATRLAQGLLTSAERAVVLVSVVIAVSAAGDPGLARLLAQGISVPDRRLWALVQLVKDGAISVPECVEKLPGAGGSLVKEGQFVSLARVAAMEMEEPALAEAIAGMIRTPARRLHLFLELARKYAVDGAHDRAHRLRAQAEEISLSLFDPQEQIEAMVGTAHLDALLGQDERARQLAETAEARLRDRTSNVCHQSRALLNLARAMMAMGDAERAKELGHQAKTLADGIGQAGERKQIQMELIDLAIAVSDFDWAGTLAQGLDDPYRRIKTLMRVARAWAEAGARNRCLDVIADIESMSGALRLQEERARVLTELSKILTLLGLHERAEEAAHRIPDPQLRVRAFVELAKHVEERHARRLLARVLGMTGWAEPLASVSLMAPSVVQAIADEQLSASAASPQGRHGSEGGSGPAAGWPTPHMHGSGPFARQADGASPT
ncbi:NACHT domain-containing protein [Streptomyces sp. MOE7]|uniref:NACHT domain-containing protein n=1 Tax=Streptomyces sp. MOE7 TaxID=1961713 RepID=UPI0011E4D70F|nr:NACHT domain-containing protein [Streptomyces sp. MOE7]